jgi:hypothetical protein
MEATLPEVIHIFPLFWFNRATISAKQNWQKKPFPLHNIPNAHRHHTLVPQL